MTAQTTTNERNAPMATEIHLTRTYPHPRKKVWRAITEPALLEKWLMHEAGEVYNYWSCMEYESNPRIKAIWERFLDYELGHLNMVMELFKKHEKRDPAELLPETLPDPIPFDSQRDFVRETLANEVDLRADGTEIVPKSRESKASREYRDAVNADGSPSEIVSAGYKWAPGSELKLKAA